MQCGISGRSIEHGLRALKSQGSCSRARCFLVFLCKWSGGSLIWEEHLRQNFTCRGGISSAFTSLGHGEHAEAGSPLSHVGERTSVSWNRAKEKNILLIITHYRFGQRIVDFFFFPSGWHRLWVNFITSTASLQFWVVPLRQELSNLFFWISILNLIDLSFSVILLTW